MLQKKVRFILIIVILILTIPAFFIHLGLMPLLADEPTRAIVALEMMISKNFVVPTINGEFYYNKPPFYNWILIAFFHAFGDINEFLIRLPSVVPLILFGLTIYLFAKKYISKTAAFLAGIFMLTCGRMLIYSSLLGHIDIFYSWITFISFIVIFEYFRKNNYWTLFAISYFIAAIGFLCKGLPSILFQGITLVAFFAIERKWKKLISLHHATGILIFILITGVYFWAYDSYNPLVNYFQTLWTESSKRTVIEKSWWSSIIHLFTFPFETLYHILPWSLLIIYAFRRSFFKILREEPFLRFCFVALFSNIIIYWLAPETYPRYLFMLYPFIFIFAAEFYIRYRDLSVVKTKFITFAFGFLGGVVTLAFLVPLFLDDLSYVDFITLKSLSLFFISSLAFWVFIKFPKERILSLTVILLLARVGFDFFVLPHRLHDAPQTMHRQMAIKVGQMTKGKRLKVFGLAPVNHDISFYITRERREILTRTWNIDSSNYYIAVKGDIENRPHKLYYTFETMYQRTPLYLVKFKAEDSQ